MDTHRELVNYLEEELGDYLVPDWLGPNLTPNDIWNLDSKRIILTYANELSSDSNSSIWPEVEHVWADSENSEELFSYLASNDMIRSRFHHRLRYFFKSPFLFCTAHAQTRATYQELLPKLLFF